MRDLAIRSTFKVIVPLLAWCGMAFKSNTQETFSAYTPRADWTNAEAVVWDVRGAPPQVVPRFNAIDLTFSTHDPRGLSRSSDLRES